ncbi:hypothetical protein G6O69_32305 [Pseudenhygromyxa sp. WMMC2535]|uniref:hypothetical protein n=1 Tax=Pseudenhygromyxa sp. WMMC2535 TaxID=2712867 RepID=UPI0015545F47|nr:hypothetical protein [Pseudenhygromyxa sp. WMMC2535]NVB42551.1 hypothetical protein [Pseudenhygromyxa sp. WMMC2535]
MTRLRSRLSLLSLTFLSAASVGCVLYVEDTQCGEFAYAYQGDCYCEDGYQGDDPRGVGCDPVMSFLITDACDDGADIEWKLFSDDRDWTWPTGDDVYRTSGFDVDNREYIVCEQGEIICFGAQGAEGLTWGVGVDYSESCDDCCFSCGSYEQDLGFLTCN